MCGVFLYRVPQYGFYLYWIFPYRFAGPVCAQFQSVDFCPKCPLHSLFLSCVGNHKPYTSKSCYGGKRKGFSTLFDTFFKAMMVYALVVPAQSNKSAIGAERIPMALNRLSRSIFSCHAEDGAPSDFLYRIHNIAFPGFSAWQGSFVCSKFVVK